MGAPKGNQFWKLRTKHGRNKLFQTPEILWEECVKYFEWCDNNPITVQDSRYTKETVFVSHKRPYTWEGLELFLDIESLRDYKTKESFKDFQQVISRVTKIIYNQKFSGAAIGIFNANIIARDLGLVDKQQNDVKVEQPLFPDVNHDED